MTKLDKNEYNLKLEEIDKYVNEGEYSEAAKVADTIDWRRVRNVRTLCMISEIYEADNRYEDSKALLVRAYRRSPVGRAILYRLVEVTIQLKQFDEAIEYYSEYVQAAPHDNNKYILKYKIYRGRGSSVEEQIEILKEYLSHEYTEKWAYELARLYQQADKIQECLATCDDLVLWFHSGKYVIKALELKRKYTNLTPKQQEIYDHRFEEEPEAPATDETVLGEEKQIVDTREDALADTIMADVEKEIAQAVAESRVSQEEEAQLAQAREEREKEAEEALDEPIEDAQAFDEQLNKYNTQELQTELVKSMREIVAGVARRIESEMTQEDLVIEKSKEEQEAAKAVQAAKEAQAPVFQMANQMKMPGQQPAKQAAQLSIDDILLSMGERGNAVRQAAAKASAAAAKPQASGVVSAMDEALMNMGVQIPEDLAEEPEAPAAKTPAEEEPIAEVPEKAAAPAAEVPVKEAAITAEVAAAEEEVDIFTAKTRRIPTDEIAELHASYGLDQNGRRVNIPPVQESPVQEPAPQAMAEEIPVSRAMPEEEPAAWELPKEPVVQEMPTEAGAPRQTQPMPEVQPDMMEQPMTKRQEAEGPQQMQGVFVHRFGPGQQANSAPAPDGEAYANRPMLKEYQRELFAGFLGIQNMEEQIASAILQAGQKGEDRTSRTGNVLIFGGHGCGKTTIATGIAKAIAQDRGSQFVKMARIYASDFNRKDIASTIAKIAGGTLIIEEAGDLEDAVVDQLTTAMEFRTDGLILILEDEQRYIHDLLMRHPRFTMKFTSQIFIPVFTIDELVRFGQIYAGDLDYAFSDSAAVALYDRIGAVSAQGEAVSITNVIELVDRAISKSNKFFRKLSGKKRYDENNCIILHEKDFR